MPSTHDLLPVKFKILHPVWEEHPLRRATEHSAGIDLRACLGSPLNALAWLARVMARAGRPLSEGDVVLSGALGPMVAATPGAAFTATIEGFGETSIRFGA